MPAVLKIDRQRRIVSSTFHGEITDDELLRHQKRIQSDPDFNPEFAEVVDFSRISITQISDRALQSLAGTRSIYKHDVPHVIVAPTDLPNELAVKYRDLVRESRPNFHVVRTIQEAHDVLAGLGFEF